MDARFSGEPERRLRLEAEQRSAERGPLVALAGLLAVVLPSFHFSIKRLFHLRVLASLSPFREASSKWTAEDVVTRVLRTQRSILILFPSAETLEAFRKALLLSFVECGGGDAEREAFIAELEAASQSPLPVILASSYNPLRRAAPSLLGRWTAVLEKYEVVYGPGERVVATPQTRTL